MSIPETAPFREKLEGLYHSVQCMYWEFERKRSGHDAEIRGSYRYEECIKLIEMLLVEYDKMSLDPTDEAIEKYAMLLEIMLEKYKHDPTLDVVMSAVTYSFLQEMGELE